MLVFWSSVELGGFMRATVAACSASGCPAEMRYFVDGENYRKAKSKAVRLWLRLCMYVFYPVGLFLRVLFPRKEVWVVTSNTFFAPWIAARFNFSKKRKVIHLVYDLFPDALVEAGVVKDGSLACRIIEWIMQDTFRLAGGNVFLGKHLLEGASARFGIIPNARIIPVGAVAEPFKAHPPQLSSKDERVSILYCGNLGRLHDYSTLIKAIELSYSETWLKKLRFIFHANGFLYPSLKKEVKKLPAEFNKLFFLEDGLEDSAWEKAMLDAHIALVTMAPSAEKVVMPSKTYSALLAGQAILAVAPLKSDLADLVRRHQCGWVVSPGDNEALANVLEEIATKPKIIFTKRQNSFNAGHCHYSAEAVSRQWVELASCAIKS